MPKPGVKDLQLGLCCFHPGYKDLKGLQATMAIRLQKHTDIAPFGAAALLT